MFPESYPNSFSSGVWLFSTFPDKAEPIYSERFKNIRDFVCLKKKNK